MSRLVCRVFGHNWHWVMLTRAYYCPRCKARG